MGEGRRVDLFHLLLEHERHERSIEQRALGRLLSTNSLCEDCLLIGCWRGWTDVCSQIADLQTQSSRPCFECILPQFLVYKCSLVSYLYDRQATETEGGTESDKKTKPTSREQVAKHQLDHILCILRALLECCMSTGFIINIRYKSLHSLHLHHLSLSLSLTYSLSKVLIPSNPNPSCNASLVTEHKAVLLTLSSSLSALMTGQFS